MPGCQRDVWRVVVKPYYNTNCTGYSMQYLQQVAINTQCLFPRSCQPLPKPAFSEPAALHNAALATTNRWPVSFVFCQCVVSHDSDRSDRFCVQPS